MDFDSFMARAWADHADDAAAVAARLRSEAPALVQNDAQMARLVALVHHVHGEHLASWDEGQAVLQALAAAPAAPGEGAMAIRRALASLRLCAGHTDALVSLDTGDAVRVRAMAASNLAARDATRAAQWLQEASTAHQAAALAAADAATRALAVAGWNIACTLEALPARSPAERELMLQAATISRQHWEQAGTWLEVERGEYRLAISWLTAGEPARARQHAQNCLDIVSAHDGPALERFFACEALGRAARAAGDEAGQAQALAQARIAFDALEEEDRGWVRPSLGAMTS